MYGTTNNIDVNVKPSTTLSYDTELGEENRIRSNKSNNQIIKINTLYYELTKH